jgi:hypothetical protein
MIVWSQKFLYPGRNRMNSKSHKNAERIIEAVIALPPVPSLLADPCDESSFAGAVNAIKLGGNRPRRAG